MKPGGPGHPTEALSAYLDGELEAPERAAVAAHVGGCAACTALLAGLERLAAAAREEEIPPTPPDLAARIAMRLDGRAAEPAREGAAPGGYRLSLRRLRAPLAAAAALVVASALWIVFQRSPGEITRQILQPEAGSGTAPERAQPPAAPRREAEGALDEDAGGAKGDRSGMEVADALAEQKLPGKPDAGRAPAGEPAEAKTGRADHGAAPPADRMAKKEAGTELEALGRSAPGAPAAQNAAAAERPAPAGPESAEDRAFAPSPPAGLAALEGEPPKDQLEKAAPSLRYRDAERQQSTSTTAFAPAPEGGARAEPAADLRSALAGGRELILGSAGYQIRLTEAGGLALRTADYECEVAAPEAAGGGGTSGATGRLSADESPGGPDVPDLFARSDRAARAAGDVPAGDAGASGPWTLRILEADGTNVAITGEDADAIAAGLRDLVRFRYAAALSDACGPLPAPFADD